MESKGISLKRFKKEQATDIRKCIICQMDKSFGVSSTENGRKRVVQAAALRVDHVHQRLQTVDLHNFVYHVDNDCYKSYTLAKSLQRIEKNKK